MPTSLAALIVGFLAALILTPLVRYLARRQGLLDEPDERKVHHVAIPRLGGIAIAAAFYLGLTAALLDGSNRGALLGDPDQFVAVLLGTALIVCIGVIDDLFGMRARIKLSAQVAVALAVALLGLSIDRLYGPWGEISTGIWAVPLTVIWFVVVMNAMNLIDGLDGLASGVALIAMGTFFVIASTADVPFSLAAFLGAGAGAVLGFLPFNLSPASIIMGDTGSILLGFLLAAASVSVTQSGSPGASPWVPLLVLGLPLVDTSWAVLRRLAGRAPIFAPDKRHVHHRLLTLGLSQRLAMVVLWAVSGAFGLLGLLATR